MRGSRSKPAPDASSTEAALDAMDADGLRALVREMLSWFDEALLARFANALVDRAARNGSGWVPQGSTDAVVKEVEAFAEAAKRVGYAEPSEVDAYLRDGSNAFLAKDYAAAFQIFRALLIPVGNVDIDLGQHEMLDEVLGIDPATCAAQYVASMYMTATPKNRGKAVLSAIDEMHGIGHFWEPLRELERVAIEPLPDLDEFLVQWKSLVEERVQKDRKNDWDSDEDRWLHEIVQRTQGPEGLAEVARASKRADDLRAWCRALVDAGDWKGALAAYDEAAELVSDKGHVSDRDEPRLATPEVTDLIRLAGVQAPTDPAKRAVVIRSMRAAAEKRIAGVTENKRRRHYGHAASFALACAQVDSSTTGTKWLEGIRDEYRRYPALQRELGGRKRRA